MTVDLKIAESNVRQGLQLDEGLAVVQTVARGNYYLNEDLSVKKERDISVAEMHAQMSIKETPRLINNLVKNYSRLVHKQAHVLKSKTSEPYEDLFQVGCMGLMVALRRFDINRKVKDSDNCIENQEQKSVSFTSFAVPYIRGHILHYLRDKSSMVRVPRSWHEIYSKYRNNEKLGGNTLALGNMLNITQRQLAEIKLACENRAVTKELSFDIPDKLYDSLGINERVEHSSLYISRLNLIVFDQSLLTSEERKTICKCYFQNLSLTKVARSSRITPTKLKVLLSQALDKISSHMPSSSKIL